MAKLTAICMQNEVFRRVVNTKIYELDVRRVVGLTDFLRGIEPGEVASMDKMKKLEQKKLRDRMNSEILYEQYM